MVGTGPERKGKEAIVPVDRALERLGRCAALGNDAGDPINCPSPDLLTPSTHLQEVEPQVRRIAIDPNG